MKYNRNPLTQAISTTLCAGAAASMALGSGVAFAQDEEEEGLELDRVQVTGSRIKRVDIENSSPVTVIDREEIDLAGDATVAELLRATPFNSFGSFTEQSGFGNGQAGVATVSLRGLGSQRTLVLINGRRMNSNPGSGAANQNINLIPLEMVERVEILRDGASAIYGSDAIAGVINIITRRNIDGVTATIQVEDSTHEGGETERYSVGGGASGDNGNVTFAIEHLRRSMIFDRDIPGFDNAVAPGLDSISSYGLPGTALMLSGASSGLNFADPRCPSNVGESSEFPNSYRWDFNDFFAGSPQLFDTRCGYNFAADTIALPRLERTSAYIDAQFDVTSNTQFLARALIVQNENESRFAGAPVTGPFPTYGADNPNNPMRLWIGQTITDPGLNGGEPYTFTDADLGDARLYMRTVSNGNREGFQTYDENNLFAGFQGTNDWLGGSDWDFGFEYSRSRTAALTRNLANKVEIQNAIDSGELDYFNVQGLPYQEWLDNTNSTLLNFNHTSIFEADTTRVSLDGSYAFDLFQMNSGPVPLVVGFEYYDLTFDQQNDPEANRLIIAGTSGGDNIFGVGRDVTSLYAETNIPVELLGLWEFNLAVRYDDYSDFGNTTNPKFGVTWRPFDALLLRASYGEGFRAPDMQELYGNQSESFPPAIDRVGCANGVAPCGSAQYRAFFGGNPDLQPEESESFTTGLVWNATDNLAFELTYYNIEFTNQISTLSLQAMFNLEAAGLTNTVTRQPNGQVDFVQLTNLNLSGVETDGIDFGVSYNLATDGIGFFNFRFEYSHLLSYDQEAIPGDGFVDQLDQHGFPEDRAIWQVGWTLGDFQVGYTGQYIGENGAADEFCTIDNRTTTSCDTAGASVITNEDIMYHDFQVAWNTFWDGQIAVGCRNCFDEDGARNPIVYGWQPVDRSLYSVEGRIAYLRYKQNF
jgi:iron complex outermembrane receptor protein